jgi:hypothetical protein
MQTLRAVPLFSVAVPLALGLVVTGCPKQALYAPNGRGGYTLTTTADSLDQAMKRFERTAARLCPDGSYELGEPRVAGSARPIEAAIELTCTGP